MITSEPKHMSFWQLYSFHLKGFSVSASKCQNTQSSKLSRSINTRIPPVGSPQPSPSRRWHPIASGFLRCVAFFLELSVLLSYGEKQNTWVFPKIEGFPPKSSHLLIGFFPLFSPSILGYPYFWKHPHGSTKRMKKFLRTTARWFFSGFGWQLLLQAPQMLRFGKFNGKC